mgnify:CR=1 FL=1
MPNFDKYCNFNEGDDTVEIPTGSKTGPYLLLHIEEFSSNIVSTSKFNKPIFCKAHFDKEFNYALQANTTNTLQDNTTRGYLYYLNLEHDYKLFYPAPLSELKKLSIELLKPDGTLYSNVKDDLQVVSILSVNKSLKLTLNKYVYRNYFKPGDKIVVKSLVGNIPLYINGYLQEGAYIYKTGTVTSDGNINEIYVKWKITGIDSSGSNIYFNNNNPTSLNTEINGFLINCNLQHTFVFEIKVQEVDSLSVHRPKII